MAFNLLIVDDSMMTRNIIKKALSITDYPLGEIHQASNGREALELMRQVWIDLVLADLNMPDMTGAEMVAAMAVDPLLKRTPVIVVSSEGNPRILEELKRKGVRECVRKPFEPLELQQAVGRVLMEKQDVTPAS